MKRKTGLDDLQHEIDALKGDRGKHKTYVSERTFPDERAAQEALTRAKEKLFAVEAWSGLSTFTADFTLHDQAGQRINRQPQPGDYIRIELPGPLPENWVQVTHVATEAQRAEFTVKPSGHPQSTQPADDETDHFFRSEARSTFRVEVLGRTLTASEIGQHEAINNQGPEAGNRSAVNTVIAEVGWLFYQKMQWKALTDYLIDG